MEKLTLLTEVFDPDPMEQALLEGEANRINLRGVARQQRLIPPLVRRNTSRFGGTSGDRCRRGRRRCAHCAAGGWLRTRFLLLRGLKRGQALSGISKVFDEPCSRRRSLRDKHAYAPRGNTTSVSVSCSCGAGLVGREVFARRFDGKIVFSS